MPVSSVTVNLEPREGRVVITVYTPDGTFTADTANLSAQTLIAVRSADPELSRAPVHTAKQLRRRSKRQEDEIAARQGAQRVKGSGAGRRKGDVHGQGELRLEAKFTRAASYTLKQEDLAKIRAEAQNLEVPAFEIHFVDKHTLKAYDRWVCVDARYYERMEYKPVYATTHNR